MKKLYLFLALSLVVAISAQAKHWSFHFTIDDPTKVIVDRSHYEGAPVYAFIFDPIEIHEGLNEFEFDEESTAAIKLRIRSTDGYILKVLKADGSMDYTVKNDNTWELSISANTWTSEYDVTRTIKTISPDEYYDRELSLSFDDPDMVKSFQIRNQKEISPDDFDYTLKFNSVYENYITIKPATNTKFYQVLVDGEIAAPESNDSYEIYLSDYTDEANPTFVEKIEVISEYPADLFYNFKITANVDADCFTEVTADGVAVKDYMNEDGFKVRPGTKVTMMLNKDLYKFTAVYRDGVSQSIYTSTTKFEYFVYNDVEYKFEAEKLATYKATITVNDPEMVVMKAKAYPYTAVALTGTDTEITFNNSTSDSDQFTIETKAKTYEITRIYDETYDKEYEITSSSTTVKLQENSHLIIESAEIIRDMNVIIYVDRIKVPYYYNITISRAGEQTNTVLGYNYVTYREKDAEIKVNASYNGTTPAIYRNGVNTENTGKQYFTFTDIVDREVIKIFFTSANAVEHTVVFEASESAFDGYEVKKDIYNDVDPYTDVFAVGKTTFTISPVARAANDLIVTIGDKTIEPDVNGVYKFDTEADTAVKVQTQIEAGISEINLDTNEAADVYNLQGIRVASKATPDQLGNLPAGLYIFNGRKVIVK